MFCNAVRMDIAVRACVRVLFIFDILVQGYQYDHRYYLLSYANVSQDDMTEEQRLLYHIMKGYDRATRPVFQAATPVIIKLGITLTQVLDVDEKDQVLTTNIWLDQEWKDERMVWQNDTRFSSVKILRIPCDLLWLPDIILYNSVDNHNKGYMKSLAMVWSDGTIFWPPIVRMRSSCKMDITYFPFDDQICKLKLGSWAYDGFQVDVTNRSIDVDLSNYVDNGEWTLVGTKLKRNVIYYACCPEPFPDVTFYLHLRRRVLYYSFNVIIPCMLLSTLTLTGFCLPPDSGEKITLGLTVLLAFSVFMLLIAENMPPTSEYIPLIGIYLTVIMAMTALSVIFSVLVLNIHHRGGFSPGPPPWIKRVAALLAKVVCIRTTFHTDRYTPVQSYTMCNTIPIPANDNMTNTEFESERNAMNGVKRDMVIDARQASTRHHICQKTPIDDEVMRLFNSVVGSHERTLMEQQTAREWQELARIMDRTFLYICVFTTLLSTIILLAIRPMTKYIDFNLS
ncbi:hypothetical protein CHS0354_023095 [Potamilus streckersoni]|uniref:Uncharacterized protein n=1 Tax=Potamilus streckersoni TaxID=2493646 RepID=A0AAE0W5C7_9BIVA|nr:hypothetical protein CHS0354_023095 [Potamilus streckersoni]